MPVRARPDLQNSAYRIIFNEDRTKQRHHNKINIRDTSVDPANIYGDSVPTSSLKNRQLSRDGTPEPNV